MATDPKLMPCLRCDTDEFLSVYKYESGWQHVECDKCFYLGPASGSRRWAIKLHNESFFLSQPAQNDRL